MKLLEDEGRLLRVFTQNIDSLETATGLNPEKVVAAHGNFDSKIELFVSFEVIRCSLLCLQQASRH